MVVQSRDQLIGVTFNNHILQMQVTGKSHTIRATASASMGEFVVIVLGIASIMQKLLGRKILQQFDIESILGENSDCFE